MRNSTAGAQALTPGRRHLNLSTAKKRLLALEGHACNFCGTTEAFLSVDHLVSRARGGDEHLSNLQLLCEPCQLKKADLDIAGLKQKGYHAEARRLAEVLRARSTWNEDDIATRLANATRTNYLVPYERYTCYTEQHQFGYALTERMITCGMSEAQLRKQVARITGNCYGRNIGRWRRTQYPSPPFFRALSLTLDWPLKTMCRHVDFNHYRFAPCAAVCHPLMPYFLQKAWHCIDVRSAVANRAPALSKSLVVYLKFGLLYQPLIAHLCEILPTLTPELLHECSIRRLTIFPTRKKELDTLLEQL